ncbi:hypothetical protein EOL96_01885 [Candidatus Saccharibacteria bacterium]|nr:hypothetical protein [Candidatus Saccharibacteria bacterium]
MSLAPKKTSGRLLSLDYLRGYFVVVIIVDHLWKYPSVWALISGEARLWVTAAEGFVMISGFLIGYIRGFKGLKLPFTTVAQKLLSRAALLYAWMIVVSMGYVALEWSKLVPNMPFTYIASGNYTFADAFLQFAIGGKPHMWIHFLYLYAIFLVLAVGAVYLLRKRKPLLLATATLAIYLMGILIDVEWMKWQLIFFLPSIIGFYFEPIRLYWQNITKNKQHQLVGGLWVISGLLLAVSALSTFAPWSLPTEFVEWSKSAFVIEDFLPLRVIVAGFWFTSLAFIFERITPYLKKYTYGVLEYLGTHSLTVYIAHGFVISAINVTLSFAIPEVWRIPYNSALGLIAILGTYFLIRVPIISKIVPK